MTGVFPTRLNRNRRLRGIKPLLYLQRILLVGIPDRLPGSKPPSLEIAGDRPKRYIDPPSLLDRQPDGISSPQCKGKLELIRRLVHQKLLHLSLLITRQPAIATVTATSLTKLERLAAFPHILPLYLADIALLGSNNPGDFSSQPPALTKPNYLLA